jgi:hypothetical protein
VPQGIPWSEQDLELAKVGPSAPSALGRLVQRWSLGAVGASKHTTKTYTTFLWFAQILVIGSVVDARRREIKGSGREAKRYNYCANQEKTGNILRIPG